MVESSLWELCEQDTPCEEAVEKSPDGRFLRVMTRQYAKELLHSPHSATFSALDNETGCEVCWHFLRLPPLSPSDLSVLLRDFSLLQSLSHPNLTNWLAHWLTPDHSVVIITERLPDASLRDYIAKIKTPRLKIVRQWMRQVLESVIYLQNVRVGTVVLPRLGLDWIYCVPSSGQVKLLPVSESFLRVGLMGKMKEWEYEADERSLSTEIYVLGMCLLEICTQTAPYDECKTAAGKARRILSGQKPVSLYRILNEDIRDFIEACIAPAEDRASASHLLLHPFLSDSSDSSNTNIILLKPKCEDSVDNSSTIEIDMVLPPAPGNSSRRIEFPFDLSSDTPDSVAEEMVEELELPQEMTPTLSRRILNAVWEIVYESPTRENSQESLPETKESDEEAGTVSETPYEKPAIDDETSSTFPLKHGFDNPLEIVKSLQVALFHIYETGGKADGIFGKKTESLVKRFQEDFHMPVTGLVTKEMLIRIREEWRWREENE